MMTTKISTDAKLLYHTLWVGILAIGLALTAVGCGDDDSSTGPELTNAEKIDLGWDKFEEADYSGALAQFQAVTQSNGQLSDAWNGAGWSSARLVGGLNAATGYFDTALQRDTIRYDAMGGWAFAVYQQGNWDEAITKATALLHRRPGWRFLHEPSLNSNDLYIMLAAAHYNLGDAAHYTASYEAVRELNPAFEADISTPAGRRELLNEIERLRRLYG